mgnify:CR=1 FL=1
MIYFDHAASTPIVEEALNIYTESLVQDFANPSAAHKLGKGSMKKVERARLQVLKLLKAKKDDQLVFLSSATEANNLVIKGLALDSNSRVHYSLGDHPSTVEPVKSLECIKEEILLSYGGGIDEEALFASLDSNSKLIVLSHVNNQSGRLYDINTLAAKIKKLVPSIHIHIDGVQALTKISVDLSNSIDSYTISGHKIGAPKGIGALFLKKGVSLNVQLHGGGHEFGIRSSTVNTPLIISFAEAIRVGLEKRTKSLEHVLKINQEARAQLEEMGVGLEFPFAIEDCSVYILSFLLPGISSDIVLRHLEMKNIFVASSSACSSKAKGFNAGFAAMKIEESKHKFVLRVSFSKDSTSEEVRLFTSELSQIIKDIKSL